MLLRAHATRRRLKFVLHHTETGLIMPNHAKNQLICSVMLDIAFIHALGGRSNFVGLCHHARHTARIAPKPSTTATAGFELCSPLFMFWLKVRVRRDIHIHPKSEATITNRGKNGKYTHTSKPNCKSLGAVLQKRSQQPLSAPRNIPKQARRPRRPLWAFSQRCRPSYCMQQYQAPGIPFS